MISRCHSRRFHSVFFSLFFFTQTSARLRQARWANVVASVREKAKVAALPSSGKIEPITFFKDMAKTDCTLFIRCFFLF